MMRELYSRCFYFFCALALSCPILAAEISLPLRINAGGPSIGQAGQENHWISDSTFAQGGDNYNFGPGHEVVGVTGAAPAKVYETVRHNQHRFVINGLPAGRYRVRFHFTDGHPNNDRAMDYLINGVRVIDDLKIFGAAGGVQRALVLEAVAEAGGDGVLAIEGQRDKGNDVFVAGIEIILADARTPLTETPVNAKLTPPSVVTQQAAPPPAPNRTSQSEQNADRAKMIREFTGAPARFVWLQGDTYSHYTDGNARVRLMALDSEDARGERALMEHPDGYSKPVFSPDGNTVVFSNRRDRKVYAIDWDGAGLRELGEGFASEVWRDPETNVEWVYLRTEQGRKEDPIVRRRIDRPQTEEKVWDRTDNGHDGVPWFQLSADGKRFSDAFPWSHCGIADLERNDWKQLGGGCWPSMAPDNSYRMFIFNGSHRDVTLLEDGGKNQRTISVADMPEMGSHKVYFPRWSNHVSFMTVTGPKNDAPSELYLGKFDHEWKRIESWMRITHNDKYDIFGDAWIKPGPQLPPGAVIARPVEPEVSMPAPELGDGWPGTMQGLVWLWDNGQAKNEVLAADGSKPSICRITLRGLARSTSSFGAQLDGGWFEAEEGAGKRVSERCRSTNQFALEALVTSDRLGQSGPARIVTQSRDAGSRNFSLAQEGDQLVLRLRAADTDGNGTSKQQNLSRIEAGRTYHVLVSYRPGLLACFVDGKETLISREIGGDLSNWEPMPLLAGDENNGGRNWDGSLEAIAIYDRFIGAQEAAHRYRSAAARLKTREPLRRIIVEAELVEITPAPALEDVAPYRRSLVENVYAVKKVTQGKLEEPRIVVAQWAILDERILPPRPERCQVGQVVRLELEPFESHPQMQSEHQTAAPEEVDAPKFYDVLSHYR